MVSEVYSYPKSYPGAFWGELLSGELESCVWLPFVDTFRTFCLNPGSEGKVALEGIQQLISTSAVSPQGIGS